jgi:hypothetical protein
MNQIQSTSGYRLELLNSVEHARRTLSPRDFSVVAPGLITEIGRLDQEIENLKFKAFMGCAEGEPLFPRVAQIVQRTYARLIPEAEATISLERKEIKRFSLVSQRQGNALPEMEPSLSMGLTFARFA